MAAFWIIRIEAEKAPQKAAQVLLEITEDGSWLEELYDDDLEEDEWDWYSADYLYTEHDAPQDFMNKVRELAEA